MKKKMITLTMAAPMAAPLIARGGGAKETIAAITAADTTAVDTADTVAVENAETSAEAAETETTGGVLVMVTNVEFLPYEYHNGGEITGIDVEIAKVIVGELGTELEIEGIAFDSIIPEITPGKADTGLAGITATEDRKQSIDFSDACVKTSQKVIVKEDSEIASPDDLAGKIVGVQLGTTGDIYVSDLEADGTTVERYNKGFEVVQALSRGKIDVVVIDGEPARTFVARTEGLKILEESFIDEGYATTVKEGNVELLDKINGTLKTPKENGTLDEVVAKHIKIE